MTHQLNFTDIFDRREDKFRAHTSDHHDARLLYRTKIKDDGSRTLYMHIGDLVMHKAKLKAGDRVRILQSDDDPCVLALAKDEHGIKLCPKSVSGSAYHEAMDTVTTCMLQLKIQPSDRLPYTTQEKNATTEWNVQNEFLIFELSEDDVSIRHLFKSQSETKPTDK